MRLRSLLMVMVLILTAGLLAAGCGSNEDTAETDEAVLVAVAEAEKGMLSRGDILTGKVSAKSEVNLVPQMPGEVASVAVDIGDRVQAGQVLMRMGNAEAQISQAEAALAQAESGLLQAELNFKDAEKTYERMKYLYEQGAVPAAEFEKVEMAYEIAREQAERMAPAQLQQARAGLDLTRDSMVMTSPITGIVAARNVDPGEMAGQSMPAFTIVNLDSMLIQAGLSEQQVNRIEAGQEVDVRISAVSDKPFTGKVTAVSPAADPQTRTYAVKVEIPNPDHLIKSGMFAEVDLSTAENEVILVPRDAVVHRSGASAVFVLTDDETSVQFRQITTGGSDGKNIAVLDGLKEGEKVVISGQEALESGTKVEVTRLGV